jgi:hypothetical protein
MQCDKSSTAWSILSRFRFPIVDGIFPEKTLFEKLRTYSSFKSIRSSGICPSKW